MKALLFQYNFQKGTGREGLRNERVSACGANEARR